MPQRFNAPPGWNVPPDFVPSADWRPDPSWPPAPEGWTYWVDDATPAAPAYGAASQAGGPQAPPAYGEAPPAYGSAPATGMPQGASAPEAYGAAPAGAYGSTDPGSAQLAIAQGQQAGARRNIWIGVGVFVAAIAVWVVSYSLAGPGDRYFAPWYFALLGIVLAVRGLIEMNKAKKALAAAQGPFGGYSPQGVTPPGQTPPGAF
jgi:hypothetical protein